MAHDCLLFFVFHRVQDPLAELVKVDPRHLGVGMYQLDVEEKLLSSALNNVVDDCVNFVGVDLNVSLLSSIAVSTHSNDLFFFCLGRHSATAREGCWRHFGCREERCCVERKFDTTRPPPVSALY